LARLVDLDTEASERPERPPDSIAGGRSGKVGQFEV